MKKWLLMLLVLQVSLSLKSQSKVYYVGHSLINLNIPYMVDSMAHYRGVSNADYRHHINIGTGLLPNWIDSANFNGNPIWDPNLGADIEYGTDHKIELKNSYQHIVLTERVPIRQNDYDSTIKYARFFYDYARSHNSQIRKYYYATWEHKTTTWSAWKDTLAVLKSYYETLVDNMKSSSSDSIFIIPANLAFMALYDTLLARGDIGGVSSLDSFFLSDGIHANHNGNYLVACVMLACIYHQNPIGLGAIKAGPYTTDIAITNPILRAKIQEIAWNISCSYIRSGLNCNPSLITPIFNISSRICEGDNFDLPTTSSNGISGMWTPAINLTTSTRYVFTPNSGQGADTFSTLVTVWPRVKPSTANIHKWICTGGDITLHNVMSPTTDAPHIMNRIEGTWTPPKNNSATTTYTFTPNPYQCADTAMMTVTVHPVPSITISAVDSHLTATSGLTNYIWRLDTFTISNANTNIYIAKQSGTYSVQARNDYCVGSASIIYNHSSPSPSAISANLFASIQVCPIPVIHNNLVVMVEKFSEYKIFNSAGSELMTGHLQIGKNEIDLNEILDKILLLKIDNKYIKISK